MIEDESNPPMRRLKVDLAELEFAFEEAFGEAIWCLDLETGAVIRISGETEAC